MPLIEGSSKEVLKENIKREIQAGKPRKQAIAIAFSKKRESFKRKKRIKITKKFTNTSNTKCCRTNQSM